jgi:hypothetical protein
MRRRKLGTTVQVNLRIREELRRQLEAAANENHRSFNQEATARLIDSFEAKPRESLEHTARRLEDLVERMGSPGVLLRQAQKKEGSDK